MKYMRLIIIIAGVLTLAAVGLLFSWKWVSGSDLNISTTSPQGNYQVKITSTQKPKNVLPGEFSVQQVKLEILRGSEKVFADDNFYRGDPYELSFLQAYPAHEWLNDSTLRLGENTSQPFKDEITVSNETGQKLDFVKISYGKHELFLIVDVAPGASLQLKASPQFDKQSPASSVSYAAYLNGQSIKGSAGSGNRNTSDGPLKTHVEIKN